MPNEPTQTSKSKQTHTLLTPFHSTPFYRHSKRKKEKKKKIIQYPQIRLHSPQICSMHAAHFQNANNGYLALLQRSHSFGLALLQLISRLTTSGSAAADLEWTSTNSPCSHSALGIVRSSSSGGGVEEDRIVGGVYYR